MDNIPEYSDIIAFGDSLHDIGNAFSITLGSFPPSDFYFEGRFSNGALAIEPLSEQLNVDLDPFYDNFDGNNFAVGGARTGRDNSNNDDFLPLGITFPGLADQVDAFIASLNGQSADADALYTLWVGPNDFLDYLGGSTSDDPVALLTLSIQNIVEAVTRLKAVGASQFLIPNMSLGRIPFSAGIQGEATGLSRAFNGALTLALDTLKQSTQNTVEILETDIFTATEQVASDPTSFGFSNITDPLLFVPGATPPDPTLRPGFFFWDPFHPSVEGNEVFADVFLKTLTGEIPQPTLNRIRGTAQGELLIGKRTSDHMDGLGGNDVIKGRYGDDRILGRNGDDQIRGNQGNDILSGGVGQDQVWGGIGDDVIFGGGNGDILFGQAGDDVVIGDRGDDLIKGGGGTDYLLGGKGRDTLSGQSQADVIVGGAGQDLLLGGSGADQLEGGVGHDILIGGLGGDRFVFVRGSGRDWVVDFQVGQDQIDVSRFGITSATLGSEITASGNRLDFGNGDILHLIGIATSTLTQSDFILDNP